MSEWRWGCATIPESYKFRLITQRVDPWVTMGEAVSATSPDYLGIEAIFNSKNYWVNMQPQGTTAPKLDFDMSDTRNWEGLLHDPTASPAMGDGETHSEGRSVTGSMRIDDRISSVA